MIALITLDEAKRHLRVDGSAADQDIGDKSLQATAIIVDYIKKPDNAWTTDTVPGVVKAAILLMLSQLYDSRSTADITDPIRNLLERSRDPAVA